MSMLIQLPEDVAKIYEAIASLEQKFPYRKFTPDGHLVGSLGEVVAEKALGLRLLPMSEPGHDACDANGKKVQIKMTAGKIIAFYTTCDRLVVLRLVPPRHAEIVYDGPGAPVWERCGKPQRNGQRRIRLTSIREIAAAAQISAVTAKLPPVVVTPVG